MPSLKGLSKQDYTVDASTLENIRTSALMRIADATERMSQNYQQCIDDRNRYERYYKELGRRLSAAKGVITKLRKQVDALSTAQQGEPDK